MGIHSSRVGIFVDNLDGFPGDTASVGNFNREGEFTGAADHFNIGNIKGGSRCGAGRRYHDRKSLPVSGDGGILIP